MKRGAYIISEVAPREFRAMASVMRLLFPLVIGVLLQGACSSTPSPTTVAGPTARFDTTTAAMPGFMQVPFPSDVYLSNGKVIELPGADAVVKSNSKFLTKGIAGLDGFSRVASTLFYIDDASKGLDDNNDPLPAEVDPASLPISEADCMADKSAVYLIDLQAADAAHARVPCRTAYHTTQSRKTRPALGIAPARGVVLEEGHKYAAVVTSRVKDKSGKAIAASKDFKTAGTGPVATVYKPALEGVQAFLKDALSTDKSTVVAIAPFTTNTTARELFKARDWLEDQPAAKLKWDAQSIAPMGAVKFAKADSTNMVPQGFISTDDWLGKVDAMNKLPDGSDDPDIHLRARAHDKVAALGTAVFDAVNFMKMSGGVGDTDFHSFTHDAQGNIIPSPDAPTAKIWMSIAIPTGTMPVGGWPVVIVQHGLGSSRLFMVDLANTFCNAGWAVAAIDSVTFGARAGDPSFQKDVTTSWAKPPVPGSKYNGPDGFADEPTNGSADLFGSLLNIGALRDQLRQAEFDTAQVVKLLRANPDLSPLKTGTDVPKLDASKVAYMGDSLGGIEGSVAAAIEPNVSAWMLNVPGGGLITDLGCYSPGISAQLGVAGGLNFAFIADVFTPTHPLVTLVQTIADGGDPLYYASAIIKKTQPLKGQPTKPRNVIHLQVMFDEVVSNESSEALARAAGYTLAAPDVGSNSEIVDLKNPAGNPHRIAFDSAKPDAQGAIHDSPSIGNTAVLVQTLSGVHGGDFYSSVGTRNFNAPYAQLDSVSPFKQRAALDPNGQCATSSCAYHVRTSYRELQAMGVGFIADAFAGTVPRIKGFKPPVRDLDDDGNPDATDPDPNDPLVH